MVKLDKLLFMFMNLTLKMGGLMKHMFKKNMILFRVNTLIIGHMELKICLFYIDILVFHHLYILIMFLYIFNFFITY